MRRGPIFKTAFRNIPVICDHYNRHKKALNNKKNTHIFS